MSSPNGETAKAPAGAGADGSAHFLPERPSAVATFITAARKHLENGDAHGARESLESARQCDPRNHVVVYELGRVDLAEGNKDSALQRFGEALQQSSYSYVPALFEAGCILEEQGKIDQAILAFRKITERDKSNVAALLHLAELYQRQQLIPDAAGYYALAADTARKLRLSDDARNYGNAALELDRNNALAHHVLRELGSATAAVTARPAASNFPAEALLESNAAGRPPQPSAVARSAQPSAAAASPSNSAAPSAAASGPKIPAPRPAPSGGVDIPPDEILEKQLAASEELASLTAAVAQAYKRRQAIEKQVEDAQAALAALQAQRESAQHEAQSAKQHLDETAAAVAADEAKLSELSAKLDAGRAELEGLSVATATLDDAARQTAAVADEIEKLRSELAAARQRSSAAAEEASAVQAAVQDSQARLVAARATAEAAVQELDGVLDRARQVADRAGRLAAKTTEIEAGLGDLEALRANTDDQRRQLESLLQVVAAKRSETDSAIARIDALRAGHREQFEAMDQMVGAALTDEPPPAAATVSSAAAAPSPVEPARAAGSASQTAAAPEGVDYVDGLIDAGRYADALRAARSDARSQGDPVTYLMSVGDRIAAQSPDYAAQAYEMARKLDKSNRDAQYKLGVAYLESGRPKEGLKQLDGIGEGEFAALAQIAAGRCLRELGRNPEAAQRFSQVLEMSGYPQSQYLEALYQLAQLQESAADSRSLELALWSYEEIAGTDPQFRDVAMRIESVKSRLAREQSPA